MKNPLVSIVIPCFNAEHCVGEAIRSALSQTYPSKEVVVVDDGSTDGSLEIIQSFGRDIQWRTGPNLGTCAARNIGTRAAVGELVQFLDSDDTLHPEKVARMVPLAIGEGSDHIVVCDWERVGVTENVPKRQSLEHPGECGDAVVWCSHHGLPTPLPLHWKSVLTGVGGFDETLPCAQERDLHLRLACHGVRFVHLPEVLVTVRRRAASLSSNSLKVLRQHLYIVNKAHRLLESLGGQSEERSAALAGLLARDARAFLQAGLVQEARDYFQAARILHPSGGLDLAYNPLHKAMARVMGPALFERLVSFKRSLLRRPRRSRGTASVL